MMPFRSVVTFEADFEDDAKWNDKGCVGPPGLDKYADGGILPQSSGN
jgi:hypothetical protein